MYRVLQGLWFLLFVSALVGQAPAFLEERRYIHAQERWIAAGLRYEVDLSVTPLSPEALAAGVSPSQRIDSVAGRAVRSDREAFWRAPDLPAEARWRFETVDAAGRRYAYDLPRAGGLEAYSARVGAPFAVLDWLAFSMSVLTQLVWMGAALLLFRARGRNPLLLAVSFGAIGVSAGAAWATVGESWSPIVAFVGYVIKATTAIALTWGLMSFPIGRLDRLWQKLFLAASAVIWLAFVVLGTMGMASDSLSLAGWAAAFVGAALAVGLRWRRTPTGVHRQQIKWAAAGFATSLLLLIVGLAVRELARNAASGERLEAWLEIAFQAISYTALICLLGAFLSALLRFRLFDVESVVGRSTALAGLALAGVAVWAAVERVVQGALSDIAGPEGGPALAAALALLSAMVVAPARKRLTRFAEKRFQPGLAALRSETPERLLDLQQVASVEELASALSEDVARALRASRAAVLAVSSGSVEGTWGCSPADVSRWLSRHPEQPGTALRIDARDPEFPARVALPPRRGARPDRWLLVGPRPDGSPPSADDLAAVVDLGLPFGRALFAAAERRAREASLRAELDALRAEVQGSPSVPARL